LNRFVVFFSCWVVLCGVAFSLAASAQTPIPDGGQFQINTLTTTFDFHPSVSSAPSGDFIVVRGSNVEIRGRRYASDGSAQGDAYLVQAPTGDRRSG
jgi:hypothetical protein